MRIEIEDTNNGYIVKVRDSIKNSGHYVFKSTEILAMLEFVGGLINDKKVSVKER